MLSDCYKNTLTLAREYKIRTIAFPSISTGIYSYPLEQAAHIAVRTVKEYIKEHPQAFDRIEWVLFDDVTEAAYRAEVENGKMS